MKRLFRFISLPILVVSLFLIFCINVCIGSVSIPFVSVLLTLFDLPTDSIVQEIILNFRFPKAATCVLAGAGLGVGGLMMQTFFRNPLAGPDVLGLSSGASLLVAFTILAQATLPTIGNSPWSVAVAATLGALLVFILIILASQKLKDNSSLLIVGMMLAAFTSSMVSVLQFLSRADDLQSFMIWSLGSVGSTNWAEIRILFLVIFVGLLVASFCVKPLNSWFLGENYGKSIGINLKKAKFWIVFSTSLMVGTITAFCGPIAFVGLAVPHLVKLVIPTNDHKILLPATALGGSILLLLCDTLAQLPGSAQVLPLNAVTSFIGAPVLIWVVIRNKKKFMI
jgi:iron complex transport system permease protein